MSGARKGIILAGGAGTRLHPVTYGISKQLLPVYDKPMVYYPLSALMLAGIRDILLISTPTDLPAFQRLLGDGSRWGLSLTYAEQPRPEGLAQAFIIGRSFVGNDRRALVLGDNLFYGHGLPDSCGPRPARTSGATVFAYHVKDPQRYGVVQFRQPGPRPRASKRNPTAKVQLCRYGPVFLRQPACSTSPQACKPSARGELEITDVNRATWSAAQLHVELLGRGIAWLDTGTHESLLQAAMFIEAIENRQGLKVCCPEEIAYRAGYIDAAQLEDTRAARWARAPTASICRGLLKERA